MNLFSSRKITGVYIGEEKIALTQLTRSFKGVQIEKKAAADISPQESPSTESSQQEPFEIEERENESKYIDTLNELVQENDFDTENLVLVLPSKDIMVRYFTLPKISRKELNSAVKFEAKKYVPFKTDEIFSDYHVIKSGSSKQNMEILFTAIKKDLVKKRISILEDCNLEVKAIRIPSLCLLNMLRNCSVGLEEKKDVPYMMVDVNEGIATVTIFKNGFPYLIRDFAIFSPLKGKKINGVSEEEYKNFIHELHLSLEYYYGQFPNESINEIFLIDDGTLRDKATDLSTEFNVSITQPDLTQVLKGEYREDFSSQLLLSTAVGYRELVKSEIDINLLPRGKGRKSIFEGGISLKDIILPRPIIIEIVGLTLGILILYVVLGKNMMAVLQTEIDRVKQSRAKVGEEYVNMSKGELISLLNKINERKNTLSYILDKRVYITNKLNRLSISLPKGMWLESISYEDKKKNKLGKEITMGLKGFVFVESKANKMDIVNNFLKDLRNDSVFTKGFERVELNSVEKTSRKNFDVTQFILKCY